MPPEQTELLRRQAFIDGAWCAADDGASLAVFNPATGEELATLLNMGAAETRRAIAAAEAALPVWRGMTAKARAQIMRRWSDLMFANSEELAALLIQEQGKPLAESRVEIVYAATIALAMRFSKLAQKMIGDYPEHESHLRAIADACRRVPAYAPRTFYEALQFAWLMHELIEMEGENVRSMGHFDRIFYLYYRADVDAGRLSPEQAKELIKFFWIKYHARTRRADNGKNFLFGGQHSDGSDVTNELTYLALEAYEELNTPDPKLSVRQILQAGS